MLFSDFQGNPGLRERAQGKTPACLFIHSLRYILWNTGINIQEASRLSGLTLDECGIGREPGIIIVAIKKADGDLKFNPTFRSAIHMGDTLIALGEISKLKLLEDMARTNKQG